ncbi:hypothetical protein CHLRE_16g686061v5 [Chlamydomonas reinhardtii]|uniref:Uncharacterized protein n=1 Tax=Chlamydomonas reinhardtii TaxID=3055 RepID=A0A2K3CW38_CHLRE|nr:uncharacterized protein CHLRE_16g686061v5 [Chlamydomonas reinhardtii]PNW72496.1 hypothetical protein CHLRE_16g686061v5 [Chlamydomonas reinhardtii]
METSCRALLTELNQRDVGPRVRTTLRGGWYQGHFVHMADISSSMDRRPVVWGNARVSTSLHHYRIPPGLVRLNFWT